jgi:hypothetical protein
MIDLRESLRNDLVWRRCLGVPGPISWNTGAHWISRDGNEWVLGYDQQATEGDIRAGGVAELQSVEVLPGLACQSPSRVQYYRELELTNFLKPRGKRSWGRRTRAAAVQARRQL